MKHGVRAVVSFVVACLPFAIPGPTFAADVAAVPDLSGVWARQAFDLERPSSGPGPIQNTRHRPNGKGSNVQVLVGGYTNPILKPQAAHMAIVDRFGSPQTEALHVVERYRLLDYESAKAITDQYEAEQGYRNASALSDGVIVDPKGLQVTITIEDPTVFTTPWTGQAAYRRAGGEWQEQSCAETHARPGESAKCL